MRETSPFVAFLISAVLTGFLMVAADSLVHLAWNQGCGGVLTICAIAYRVAVGHGMEFLNASSLLSAYTARLTRTFLGATNPRRTAVSGGRQGELANEQQPDSGDELSMEDYTPWEAGGPLHLIGLCVNETVDAASQREVADRKALAMTVGPAGVSVGARFHALWFKPPVGGGSPSDQHLPWSLRLGRWLDGVPPSADRRLKAIPVAGAPFHVLADKQGNPAPSENLRLSQWIAISGAAFGTGSGRGTNKALAIMCGIANIRLGYWWDSGIRDHKRPDVFQQNLWQRIKRWPARLIPTSRPPTSSSPTSNGKATGSSGSTRRTRCLRLNLV
ncbi:MAG: hypothetical protein ACKV19_09380 [Verrucomicrobiales bacterium]